MPSTESYDKASYLDWALVQLSDSTYYQNMLVANPGTTHLETLALEGICSDPPIGQVLVATRRGIVRAKGTGSASTLNSRAGETSQSVWSIDLEESLG